MKNNCRHCQTQLNYIFADLGMSPMANAYVSEELANRMEPFFPLKVYVCSNCFLVQLEEFESPNSIFSDYLYFSSFSKSLLKHSEQYVDKIVDRFALKSTDLVVEVASNDGYLLQYFSKYSIPVLGIEPAANIAETAIRKGIPTCIEFLGEKTAQKIVNNYGQSQLTLGNNVLAHVPDINDFVKGLKILTAHNGIITMEFPHLLNLVKYCQFDTIYHEHFSYLSLTAVDKIFQSHGLTIFDVEQIPTHGGSLRIYACHNHNRKYFLSDAVTSLLEIEKNDGLASIDFYKNFQKKINIIKNNLLEFLIQQKSENKKIAAYGAPAKASTLLNYAGVKTDYIDFTVDISPHKQGRFIPGVRIPIVSAEKLSEFKPDVILILAWNLADEISKDIKYVRDWNCKLYVVLPEVKEV